MRDDATSFCDLGYHTWERIPKRPGWYECVYCHTNTEG